MIPAAVALAAILAVQAQDIPTEHDRNVPEVKSDVVKPSPAAQGLLDEPSKSQPSMPSAPVDSHASARISQRFIIRRLAGGNGDVYQIDVLRDDPVPPAVLGALLMNALEPQHARAKAPTEAEEKGESPLPPAP